MGECRDISEASGRRVVHDPVAVVEEGADPEAVRV